MIRRSLWFGIVVLLATACTEKLTAPADCPALCPGGSADFRDTVITATLGLDSTFVGYVGGADQASMLLGNGGSYGTSRGIVRFFPRGDSIIIRDTARAFTVDSAIITLGLQASDSTSTNVVVELFRVPRTLDSTATVAQVDASMTPANLLREFTITNDLRRGTLAVLLTGADLAKLAFTAVDSTQLAVGIRVRADGPTGVRIGTSAAGVEGPVTIWHTKAAIADTALQKQILTRVAATSITIRPAAGPLPADLLAVGGVPVARSFVRFTLPPSLKDSVTIIRATLELTLDQPLFGIPGDTTTLLIRPILTNLGAKSPVTTEIFEGAFLVPGQSSLSAEVAALVRLWQGADALPAILRLQMGDEGGTFSAPFFRSSRSSIGMPRLRITYRRSFAFEGF